ncbi:MAG TPA: VWA domain-containing protein [Bryobacteraceae bacterium]|nr:VWA domain-containing protein [Bryobacteraceae bacterium]
MIGAPRWRVSCLTPLLLLTIGEVDAQRSARAPDFRVNTQMVLVPVTVTDHYGKTIMGLQAKDFNIFEDQTPQQIVSFGTEDAPCSAGLVLDVSGSMRSTLGVVKDSARAFVRTAGPDDEFLLLTVSTLPGAGSGFTTDTEALEDDIAGTRPGGFTALIDTVYLGLNQMRRARNPQRALVIISDGVENHSRYSKSELLRIALEADVQIYAIIIDNGAGGSSSNAVPFVPSMAAKPGAQAAARQGPNLLEELAAKTGGLFFHARNDAEAKEGMMKAGQALRNKYLIGYQPADSELPGKWHRIRVKSNVPKVNVHARNGYYSR